ncbi:MAG: hypothetical protein XE08_0210 [Parcubacteria bacterium 32_520]|nr:MAG: hypothetical protein XE08_0210 [Parcubacteria bacterium 32_520]
MSEVYLYIKIEKELKDKLKIKAIREGQTLKDLVINILENSLEK